MSLMKILKSKGLTRNPVLRLYSIDIFRSAEFVIYVSSLISVREVTCNIGR